MSKTLRVGVIGAGRIGKLHANNLATRVPNVELAAVSDVYEPAAKELAEKLNIPKYYSDYHKILEDPKIDAVFICSSTDTHSPISMEAAKAGKPIFCEKPIDHASSIRSASTGASTGTSSTFMTWSRRAASATCTSSR